MKKDVIYSSAFIRNLRSQEEMSLKYKKTKESPWKSPNSFSVSF